MPAIQIFAYSGLINGIFALGFGILIIYKAWRSKINRLFFLMTLAVAFWSICYWQWLLSGNGVAAIFWVRMLSIGSLFIPVFYFHWILYLLDIYKQRNPVLFLKIAYALSAIILLFSYSALFIKNLSPKLFFLFWPDPGVLYTVYLIFIYGGLVAYSLLLLNKSYKSASEERKGQILYVILGAIFGFGGGLTNFFLWYNIPIIPFGNFLVALFPFFLGYATMKHHLFNIKSVAADLLVFSIWTAVFVEVLLAESFKEKLFQSGLFILVVIIGILLIRSFLKLEKANERLRQLDRLKSEFLSFASHQVKAPMTSIKGHASLIADGSYGRVTEDVKEKSLLIREITNRTVSLVDDFLNLRKIEEGKMRYQFSNINITELIESIIQDLTLMAKQKKLNLTFKKPNVEMMIRADRQKLRQVIQNLMENAIKYTEKGYIKVELKANEDSVRISVSDSGRGISKKLLPNLFRQFTRASSVKKIQGTGLGLYIAKMIIDAHHGKIWAESSGEGEGSTFYMRLPREMNSLEKSNKLVA